MKFSAKSIAELIGGEVSGNPETLVSKLCKIEEGEEGALTFLANPKYEPYIYDTKASVVIVNKDFKPEKPLPDACTLIVTADAYMGFTRLLEAYDTYRNSKTGIHPQSFVAESAKIGKDVYIGPFVSIGENCVIGNNVKIHAHTSIGDFCEIDDFSTLHSNVAVYHSCVIGKNCIIHSGVSIGADGFGFAPEEGNGFKKIPQIGNVRIDEEVEIGANTCIDRATIGSTHIHRGVKIDNLVQIAHNVVVGENTIIVSQTGIAGSTKIGKNCLIGGQVGIVGHLNIADGVKIAAQSGVGSSIAEPGSIVQGSPAFAVGDYKRAYVGFRKLPEILERLQTLEKKLNNGK